MVVHMKFTMFKKINFKINYRTLLILTSVSMVSFFIIYLGVEYYSSIDKYISEKVISINKNNLHQTGNYIDAQLNQMKDLTEILASNNSLLEKVYNYDSTQYSTKVDLRENIIKNLGRSSKINSNILAITILTKDNVITVGHLPMYGLKHEDLSFVENFDKTMKSANNSAVFLIPAKTTIKAGAPTQLYNIFEQYNFAINLYYEGNIIGMLFVSSNENMFETMLKKSKDMVIFDRSGDIIYNNTGKANGIIGPMHKQALGVAEKGTSAQNLNDMLLYTSSSFSGIQIGYLFDRQEQHKKINIVKIFFLTFIFVLLIVVFALSGVLSRILTRPVNGLVSNINKYDVLKKTRKVPFLPSTSSKFALSESILIFFIGIVMLSAITLIVSTYFLFSNIIKDYVFEATKNGFDQTVDNLNSYLINVKNVSTNIIYDETIYNHMKLSPPTLVKDDSLEYVAAKNLSLYNGKTEINIYNSFGSNILSFTPYVNSLPFDNYNEEVFFKNSNYIFKDTIKGDDGMYYIPFWMKMRNVISYEVIGYFECRLNELDIEKLYNNLNSDYGKVFIVDNLGTIISHSNKNLIGTQINLEEYQENSGNHHILMQANLKDTPWTIISSYQDNIIKIDKANFLLSEINLFIITMVVTFITAILFSRNLSKYFKVLLNKVNSMTFDNLYKEFPENSGINEVNQLGIAFNNMAIRIESLLDEVIISTKKAGELEKTKNQAEFTSLQAQIKPHFLYNTFESINWMIRKDNKSEALFMINCLSSMLRFVAKKDDTEIPITKEIGYTKTYIEIMKTRYQDELIIDFDIDEKLFEYKTIKLILQPIIENAIYHGIKPKGTSGKIFVLGRLIDTKIVFEIIDDGIGMNSDTLKEVREMLSHNITGGSIGLQNVQTRIKLFYGEEYGLSVASNLGFGTTVTICIPGKII